MKKLSPVALQSLTDTYNLVGDLFYLSTVFQPNGKKQLYDYLKSNYKVEFAPHDRIIFIQDADHYDYDDAPGQAIALLQEYLLDINIDNFFILVVGSNKMLSTELAQLQQENQLHTPIQHQLIDQLEFDKITEVGDTFCMLPWIHVHVETSGDLLPCCIADPERPMGNAKNQSIDEIFNSEQYKKIRRNMLAGKKSPECAKCYQLNNYKNTLKLRDQSNKQYGHYRKQVIENTDSTGNVTNYKIRYLDIRLSNVCNLKCRTCDGHWSSLLSQEESLIFNNNKNSNLLSVDHREKILPEILDYLETVDTVYFAGGEPLLSAEHYKILDRLLELNRTDVELVYNTNFTNLNYKKGSVVDYWKKFSCVRVGASLDGHGPVVEYIRHGIKWQTIEDHLAQLKTQVPHVKFFVTSTVSLMSVLSIIELQQMWHTQRKVNINDFKISLVFDDFLNLQVLPAELKLTVSGAIADHVTWLKQHAGSKELINSWQEINQFMLADDQTHRLKKMWYLTKKKDQARNECFETIFPNFYTIIKSYV